MDYLSEMTEYEYLMSNIEYPQIVLITDINGNYLRWTAPQGYKILDTSEEMWICSDGDFLVKI